MKRVVFILTVLLLLIMPWAGSVVLAGSPYPVEWIRQFGTNTYDAAYGVAVDSSGNIFTAGWTEGALPGQISAGGPDAVVRKYNSAGAELATWQYTGEDWSGSCGLPGARHRG